FNNSISIAVSKETTDKTHTNFDKTVTYESKAGAVTATMETEMKEFNLSVLAYYLNTDITTKAAASETIELTITSTDITATDGFMYPIEGAIDTVVVNYGVDQVAELGVHYDLHNGAIIFNSLERQTANGATSLIDPTSANVECEIVVTTLAGEVAEFESRKEKNYALYAEIYNGDYLDQYYIHKTKPVL